MSLFRSLPPADAFGTLIQELTSAVEMMYPDSSPLEENSARKWAFIASRGIYRCTGDDIAGTVACIILLSFMISRNEPPIYVFIACAIILVAAYLIGIGGVPTNG